MRQGGKGASKGREEKEIQGRGGKSQCRVDNNNNEGRVAALLHARSGAALLNRLHSLQGTEFKVPASRGRMFSAFPPPERLLKVEWPPKSS